MLRTILILVLIVVFLSIAVTFAWLNPESIEIDFAFYRFETTQSVAFAVCFALGWLFGLLCCSGYILSLLNQRRRLRKSVRLAEAEVSNLRSLPLNDAG